MHKSKQARKAFRETAEQRSKNKEHQQAFRDRTAFEDQPVSILWGVWRMIESGQGEAVGPKLKALVQKRSAEICEYDRKMSVFSKT